MKKFSVLLVAIMIALFGSQNCLAQSGLFKEAAAIKGVTSVYISPMLLNLGANLGDMNLGHGLYDAVSEIKWFEIITCDGIKEVDKVKNICNNVFSKLGCKILMEVNDDNESVKIYGTQIGNTNFVDKIVIEVYDSTDNDYVMIYIMGKIDLSKIHPK